MDKSSEIDLENLVELEQAQPDFAIVGIGASAGGLRAIEDFFDNMPANNGAAFVVIQHLSPDFKSLMNELLERRTQMDVCVATEGVLLAPNTIFLIPPGQNMALVDGHLHLTPQDRSVGRHPHFPIDLFFQSLAIEGKDRVISIVLSGTGSDGTRGIQSIAEAGGIVLVQDPITAEFDGMPRSAIITGLADLILPPHVIASTTYQLVTSPGRRKAFRGDQKAQINPIQLKQIVSILENHENIDFTQYKPNTLARRIKRRCLIAGHSTLDTYIQKLQNSELERSILRNDLLITVTRFFRDIEAWEFLETDILPEIVKQATPGKPIRVWITACATGEEAYSIAMLLHELLEKAEQPLTAKIFATDIDSIALAKASAGTYPKEAISDLSEARRDRFFTHKGETVVVSRSLRAMIIFADHNLTKDASFTQMDLVSCRNVLIYMQPELQQQVLRNLHFSLKLNSILFLGESENLGGLEKEFKARQRKWKIYQKLRDVRLPLISQNFAALSAQSLKMQSLKQVPASPRFDPLLETAFQALLHNRKATCFLVDRDNQLIHLCGDALKLLKISSGRASQDVVRMMPESLQIPLTTALHRARQKDIQVTYGSCRITEPGIDIDRVALEVSQQKNLTLGTFLMVMIEQEKTTQVEELSENLSSDTATAQYVMQLQQELQATRENLQATIEELETTNEEQQSTNEELIASNEELQSSNEELHSVNEELHTINSEHQAKIQELVQLNNDLDNLLNSIDIGVIFLDNHLRIRKFTPAATLAFNLVNADIGRPLEHLAHNLGDFNVLEALMQTQQRAEPTEHKVRIKCQGPYLLMHIYPYLTENKATHGLILTLVNVDEMQTSQQLLADAQANLRQVNERLEHEVRERTAALKNSQQLLESIAQATPNAIYIYDMVEHRNVYANAFLERLLGYSAEEIHTIGDDLDTQLFHPDDVERITAHHQVIAASSASDDHVFEIEYRLRNAKGQWRYFYSQDIIFERDSDGHPTQILGTAIDISDRKAAALKLKNSEARYRSLYQSTPIMMHAVNHQGTLLSVNNTWLNRLGYEEKDVIGKPISVFLTNCLEKNIYLEACHDLPCQLVCKNGETLDVLLSAVVEQDVTGLRIQLLTVMIDVTERNKAEAELCQYREHLEELVEMRANEIQKANQQLQAEVLVRQQAQNELARRAQALERSNASLEEFAYVVSHDLQEPLRAMTVFSQLLEQRYQPTLDDTISGYLNNIVQGGIRMQALIDGILDFSRLTHRGQHLSAISLESVVETVIKNLQTTLTDNQATVLYNNLPTVIGDYNQIIQLFQNLISNAVKFKKSNEPPHIQISAEQISAEQISAEQTVRADTILEKETDEETLNTTAAHWLIAVKDNGLGIPTDQQNRIFTLFQRLHTQQEREGYGIGLAICKTIVERHHGKMWVESEINQGATFYFTLQMSADMTSTPRER